MDIIGDLLFSNSIFFGFVPYRRGSAALNIFTERQDGATGIGPKQKHRAFMATTIYRPAIKAFIAFVVVFGSGAQAIAGTFAVAPAVAAPSASIARSTMVTNPSAEILPSQIGSTAGFTTVNHDATAANFNAVTPTAVTTDSFANVAAGLNSSITSRALTGSFGTSQSQSDPSAGGATDHGEVPGSPDMGAANSVSGSIANATGSPLVSINSYSDGSAVRENQAIGAANAYGPVNAVGGERSTHYESYEYSNATGDFGTRDLKREPRLCVLPGNAQCSIGVGLAGKQCFCRTPEGAVNGISR